MNGRPEMIRQQGMPHLSQNVLGMNQPFLPPQPSSAQPPQGQPHHMNLVQNSNNMNPNMGYMPAGQPSNGAPNSTAAQLSEMHLQQATNQRRQQALLRQAQLAQNAQNINQQPPATPSVLPHLNGIGQSVSFPGNMMQAGQPNVPRRVVSQPHPGGPSPGGPMNGMHPGPQGMVGIPMNMPPGMGAPRQQQPPMNMRAPPPNQQQAMAGHMSTPGAMGMNRPGHGIPSMPQGMPRNASAQPAMMGSMQPGQPHPSGMPPHFQNPLSHQPPPMGSSPRPNSHAPSLNQQGNPPMQVMDRARISVPDPSMYYPNPQFTPSMGGSSGNMPHPANRIPGAGPSNAPFAFGPSSTPPNVHSDAIQNVPGGVPPNVAHDSANRANFHITPAQQLAHMNTGGAPGAGGPGEGYPSQFGGMPPPPPQAGLPQSGPPGGPPPPGHQQHHHHHQQQQASQPPRPQSRQRHPTPQLSPRHSQEQMNGHMVHPARPPSQPQQHTPGRPPSQQSGAGTSRTPRVATATLPPNATLLQGRPANIGGPPPSQLPLPGSMLGQPPLQGGSPSSTVAPGPVLSMGMHSIMPPQSANSPPDNGMVHRGSLSAGPPLPRTITQSPPPLGSGQAIMRLLQLSGTLAAESHTTQRLQLSHWEDLVQDFFMPSAQMKLMLWKDNQRNEAKVFDVTTPILPRFFLVTSQSGVRTMSLTLDGAQERLCAHNLAVVECVSAIWTYRYTSGYIVTLRGPLRAEVFVVPTPPSSGASAQSASNPNYTLKLNYFEFDSRKYERHVLLDAVQGQRIVDPPKTPRVPNAQTPTMNGTPGGKRPAAEEDKFDEQPRMVYDRASLPAEPVNAFGIPQATMRCLELAESVVSMTDLIHFSSEKGIGPIDALKDLAQQIRETHVLNPANGLLPGVGLPPGPFNPDALNGAHSNSNSLTLYPPAPNATSLGGAQQQQQQTPSSIQQGMPGPASNAPSPDKPKGTPKQAHASHPAGSSGASTNPTTTPAMTNASLKRKAQSSDTASPTTANADQPPPKRAARKRRTNTAG